MVARAPQFARLGEVDVRGLCSKCDCFLFNITLICVFFVFVWMDAIVPCLLYHFIVECILYQSAKPYQTFMKGAKMGAYPQGLSLLDTLQRLPFGFCFNRAMNCDHDNTIRTIAKNVLTDAFRDDPSILSFAILPSSMRTRPSR